MTVNDERSKMNELVIVRGISASGKSTWAKEQEGYVVVSRDDLRMSLFGIPFGGNIDEDLITSIEHSAISAALVAGFSVISDNTNLNEEYVQDIAEIGFRDAKSVRIHEIFVSLENALFRNRVRSFEGGRFVPENVIRTQFERYVPLTISRK